MRVYGKKFATFNKTLLHTMFVDKKLSCVKAVQTLSRFNRTMKGKADTFVLDFVNEAEEIKKSFQPYYEGAVIEEETGPNVIYDLKNAQHRYAVEDNAFKEEFKSYPELLGEEINYIIYVWEKA
jgi:type I restriction enzyme, R subunit